MELVSSVIPTKIQIRSAGRRRRRTRVAGRGISAVIVIIVDTTTTVDITTKDMGVKTIGEVVVAASHIQRMHSGETTG